MNYVKLTDQNLKAHDGFQWEIGKWVTTSGEGELCTEGWLHCYSHILLAVLLNSIYGDIKNPRAWKVQVRGKKKIDCGLKYGFTKMRLLEELPLPEITTTQRVAFGILCALEVYKEPRFVEWAQNWLSGKDRSQKAAEAAWAAGAVAEVAWAAWAEAARAAAWAATEKEINLIAIAKQAMKIK